MKNRYYLIALLIVSSIYYFYLYYFNQTIDIVDFIFPILIVFLLLRIRIGYQASTPKSIIGSKEGILISKKFDLFMRGQINEEEIEKFIGDFKVISWDELEYWYLKYDYFKNDSYEFPKSDYYINRLHAVIKINGHNNEFLPYNSSSHILIDSLFKYAPEKKRDSEDNINDNYNHNFRKSIYMYILFIIIVFIVHAYIVFNLK